jgi:hypothetical protein
MRYSVHFTRPEFFEYGVFGTLPNPANLSATVDIEADGLDTAYQQMRTDNWARQGGDAYMFIINKGLDHFSMSVGDVLIDDRDNMHVVGPLGFRTVEGYRR